MARSQPDPLPADGPLDVGPDEAHDAYGALPPPSDPGVAGGLFGGRSVQKWMAIAVAALVLAAGGVLGIKAVTGSGSRPTVTAAQGGGLGGGRAGGGTFGTLQSVDGSTLTISTFNGGTTAVTTSASTKVTKAAAGSLGDVKVGDRVVAVGTSDGTNAITAQRITDSGANATAFGRGQGRARGGAAPNGGSIPPNGGSGANGGGGRAAGTVKSISGTTLTVAQTNGTTVTVRTGSGTTVSVLRASSLQQLTIGQPVTVSGTTNSDGTVAATAVQQGAGGFGPGSRGAQGAGGAVNGSGSSTP